MRFLFIDSKENDKRHYLVLDYCNKCTPPKEFLNHWAYPNASDRRGASCFNCGKIFDGNTSAVEIIIILDGLNVNHKNEEIR